MSVGASWAAFRKRCEEDPDYARRKKEQWAEATEVRGKMERWGCYRCSLLQTMVSSREELTDGCSAIEPQGAAIADLHSCPMNRSTDPRGRNKRRR